jgi:hypothetical protein
MERPNCEIGVQCGILSGVNIAFLLRESDGYYYIIWLALNSLVFVIGLLVDLATQLAIWLKDSVQHCKFLMIWDSFVNQSK